MSSEWSLTITHGFFSQLRWQEKRGIHLKTLYFFGSVEQNELNNLSCYLKIPIIMSIILHLSMDTRQKACSNTTRQTWRILPPNINFEVWQLLKQSTKLKTFNLKSTTQDFLPFFKTSPLFSRLFPGIENYWANFQEFKTLYEPCWYCEYMGISRAHTMNLKYSSHWQGT